MSATSAVFQGSDPWNNLDAPAAMAAAPVTPTYTYRNRIIYDSRY